MDLFLNFISRLISGFFIAHILWIIFSRRPRIPVAVLSILIATELFDVAARVIGGASFTVILLAFALQVLPYVFSLLLFMRVTGQQLIRLRVRRRRVKSVSSDVITVRKDRMMALLGLALSVAVGIPSVFVLEGWIRFALPVVMLAVFVLSALVWFRAKPVKSEAVLLVVGKDNERLYTHPIDPSRFTFKVKDFFDNPDFIVDPVGTAVLRYPDKAVRREHVYRIQTSAFVDMKDAPLKESEHVVYRDELDRFEKYHYRIITFDVSKTGRATIVKTETIR
jgi:hypothetical protein